MKAIIHVDQHILRGNRKTGSRNPPLSLRTYRSIEKAQKIQIVDDQGKVIATLKYQPDDPLKCGATVWLEADRARLVIADEETLRPALASCRRRG